MSQCLISVVRIRKLRFCINSKRNTNPSSAEFLDDQFGYRTVLSRLGLNDWVNYTERNLIENWFHTLKMRIDFFHNLWVDSWLSAQEWIENSCITITATDRIKLLTERRGSKRCRTRRYRTTHMSNPNHYLQANRRVGYGISEETIQPFVP